MRTVRAGAVRVALRSTAIVCVACAITALCVLFAAGWMFAARDDEWSVPIRVGGDTIGVKLDASVASLLRFATHPLGLRLLDGRSLSTRSGVLRLTRLEGDRFALDCAPCRLRVPALGDEALDLQSVRIVGTQRVDQLAGTLIANTDVGTAVTGTYAGRYDGKGMTLELALDRAPIATWYRVFGANVPEAATAAIGGTASFAVRLELPSARLLVKPKIDGFTVSGLGTERLLGRAPTVSCGAPTRAKPPRREPDFGFWLPRAVVAAEDQRYEQHPGYDLDELASSLARNQSSARIERGGSTIPQQLAKLLYVGSERTVGRKLRELLYAVEMEQTLGKARMLRLYLSIAPWGEGTCGAEAASRHYFQVPVTKLSGAQAVWLAAMLHGPDVEAARWSSSGSIDLERATWVAHGLARVKSTARARILDELATMAPSRSPTVVTMAEQE